MTFIPNPNLARELKTDAAVRGAMDEVGEAALEAARELAPVASGALRDSLKVERIEDGGVRLSVNVDYWLFPEFGTVFMAPEPYLRPSLSAVGLGVT